MAAMGPAGGRLAFSPLPVLYETVDPLDGERGLFLLRLYRDRPLAVF